MQVDRLVNRGVLGQDAGRENILMEGRVKHEEEVFAPRFSPLP